MTTPVPPPEELAKLNLVELLDLLQPIPEPEPVSMMPQTAGWIWLGLGVAAALIWLLRRFLRYRRANAYRRAAVAAIDEAGDDPAALALILRRTALGGYPRPEVAGRAGADWLRFLEDTSDRDRFETPPGSTVATAPYQRPGAGSDNARGLGREVKSWARHHKSRAKDWAS